MGNRKMEIGDKVRCIRTDGTMFTQGKEYTVLNFDQDGDPNFKDDDGDYDPTCGYPLDGYFWAFELIEE